MRWLNQAYRRHDEGMNMRGVGPIFGGCRGDVRFQDLLRRLKLIPSSISQVFNRLRQNIHPMVSLHFGGMTNWEIREILFFSYGVGKSKSAKLDDRSLLRGPDAELLYSRDGRAANSLNLSRRFPGQGFINSNVQSVLSASPADEILAGLEMSVSNPDRYLRDEIVGVLALGGIAGRDKNRSGDEVSLAVGDSGGGAELGFNAFAHHRSAGRDDGLELSRRRAAPTLFPDWPAVQKRRRRQKDRR